MGRDITTLKLENIKNGITFVIVINDRGDMGVLTKEEVQSFLEQFHAKLKVFGIIYRDDRGKNQKALEELEIVPSYRKVVRFI